MRCLLLQQPHQGQLRDATALHSAAASIRHLWAHVEQAVVSHPAPCSSHKAPKHVLHELRHAWPDLLLMLRLLLLLLAKQKRGCVGPRMGEALAPPLRLMLMLLEVEQCRRCIGLRRGACHELSQPGQGAHCPGSHRSGLSFGAPRHQQQEAAQRQVARRPRRQLTMPGRGIREPPDVAADLLQQPHEHWDRSRPVHRHPHSLGAPRRPDQGPEAAQDHLRLRR